MDKEIKGILIEYEDGSSKQIEKGCCVDLGIAEDELTVDMLNARPADIVRLACGLVFTVERFGLMDLLQMMITAEVPEEKG